VTIWAEFIGREHDIDMKVLNDVCNYVANNVYVNQIKLGNVVPELNVYMAENYDPEAEDLVTMFGLQNLSLLEDAHGDVSFDFTIHEDEIQDILNIRFDQWNEATEMMEAYEAKFVEDLDAAWNGYVDDTLETVQ